MPSKNHSSEPRPSPTRAFMRAAKNRPDYSFFALLHGLLYSRWPYLYIGIGKGDHPIAKVLAPVFNAWSHFFP